MCYTLSDILTGKVLTFDASGRLTTDADAYGNSNTFTYAAMGATTPSGVGNIWLMAPDGRATVLSTRTGHVVATIDPSYTKAQYYWTQNKDLVIDGSRGLGYISWESGTATGGQQVGFGGPR